MLRPERTDRSGASPLQCSLHPGRPSSMAWRIGVDIGGTFTDVALVDDASGRIGVAKVPTTPARLRRGRAGRAATRRCSATAWRPPTSGCCRTPPPSSPTPSSRRRARAPHSITTRGFRDVLELRRSARADLYDLFQDAPATLIPRRRRFEITERIGADGEVVTPLAESEIDGADRGAEGGARRGGRRLAAVQLPQPGARAPARRAPARGAAGRAGLPVLGGAARDQGVRAHQHDGGVRLRRADPRLLPRSGWRSATRGHRPAARSTSWARTAACSRPPRRSPCRRWRWSSGPAAGVVGGGARGAPDRARATSSPSTWAAPPPRRA